MQAPAVDAGVTPEAGTPQDAPQNLRELQALVTAGAYSTWPAEAAPHASAGPHGGLVRTFVNPRLRDSLKAGARTHPLGSVVVKELSSNGAITGYAIDAKRADGQWLFLEGFLPSLNQYYFVGTTNLCANCHRQGPDYVLTPPDAIP